jgi:hypothetical protein
MARGTTLIRLLDLYRAECRLSLNPAHNAQVRDTQVSHLQRVQEWLWSDFAWPILRVERFLETQNGQRFHSMPDDLDIDRITKIEVKHDDVYTPLRPGIDAEHYAAYDSDKDERQWPPQRWRISEDEQIELWPIPDTDYDALTQEGRIKITGIRKLQPLVDDGDRVDLDDRLVSLYAAAEFLAGAGAKDAGLKQQQANARYARLRGQQSPKRQFRMFGVGQPETTRRIPIAVYNKPTS